MVAHRAHHQHGGLDVHQRQAFAFKLVMAFSQRIVQEQAGQVFVVHALRQAGQIGVPAHHVHADLFFTQQIAVGAARPDQVARIQKLKSPGHLLA